MYVCTCIVV